MAKGIEKQTIQRLLSQADIQINGNRTWDIQVREDRLYNRILAGGSLALGESYQDYSVTRSIIEKHHYLYQFVPRAFGKVSRSVYGRKRSA